MDFLSFGCDTSEKNKRVTLRCSLHIYGSSISGRGDAVPRVCVCVFVVCVIGGLPLCQKSSVTLADDQSPPWDPLPHTLSQAANWTEIAQPCSSHSTRLIQDHTHTHTHTHIYTYTHATPLLFRVFHPTIPYSFLLQVALLCALSGFTPQ